MAVHRTTRTLALDPAPGSGTATGGSVSRRTLLLGAAGGLTAAGLSRPGHAAGQWLSAGAARRRHVNPVLVRRLRRALREALHDPGIEAVGGILHVDGPALGRWTGAAGLGRVHPDVPMRPTDRFRAGSIVKMFVAVRVLQLSERGRLSLDARLPEVLPAHITRRFANARNITVRMLLGHRSGIPEWESPTVDIIIGHHPAKVWTIPEKLDLAAAQPPGFAPGTSYAYSNTDYTLLGLIIEHLTGRTWRHEVARGVIRPLNLSGTSLPAPRHRAIRGPHAHGYAQRDGRRIDITGVDPSMAGAAGGSALVSTAEDLARFVHALLGGRCSADAPRCGR